MCSPGSHSSQPLSFFMAVEHPKCCLASLYSILGCFQSEPTGIVYKILLTYNGCLWHNIRARLFLNSPHAL